MNGIFIFINQIELDLIKSDTENGIFILIY